MGSLTGIAQVLIGFLLGTYLYNKNAKTTNQYRFIILLSISMFILAKLWNLVLPINKPLWTSSYVLYICSIVMLFLLFLIVRVVKLY